jgi:hypothetical protein
MTGRSNAMRTHASRDGCGASDPMVLLPALKAAHRRIESCIAELETITSGGLPDAARFGAIRLRVGQANLARRQIARRICSHLIAVTSIDKVEAVRELQRRDCEQFQRTSELIGCWTPQVLQNDWRGYCNASRRVRDGLREIVVAEKKLLYPLLQRSR